MKKHYMEVNIVNFIGKKVNNMLILSVLTGLFFKDYYIGMFIGFLIGKVLYKGIWKEE